MAERDPQSGVDPSEQAAGETDLTEESFQEDAIESRRIVRGGIAFSVICVATPAEL